MPLENHKKEKILLIYPPITFLENGKTGHFYCMNPPLGLAYIAAVLDRAGYEVEIIDAKLERLSIDDILKKVSGFNPRIIGISSSTPDFFITKSLAKAIKSLGDYTVVIGGPHVSALPEETMETGCFDYGLIDEGEDTILELVDAICDGKEAGTCNIMGVVFREGSRIVKTPRRPYIKDLDTIPFPAWRLLSDISRYEYKFYKYLPKAPIITSRGCPYQCTFCDRSVFGSKVRMRSIGNILDEVEMLVKDYGVREIEIVDDLFTVNRERVMEFCSKLMSRRLKIAWLCMGRVNCVTPEMLRIMKKAGCWHINYGIESGNQKILDSIKKDITLEVAEKAVSWTKRVKIRTQGFFLVGLPGDDEKSMRETIDFSKRLSLDRVAFCITQPFPGSELYKTALARGEIRKDVGYHYYDNDNFHKELPYVPRGLTAETLVKCRNRFYREFYMRPSFVINQIFSYREFRAFPRRIRAFMKSIF